MSPRRGLLSRRGCCGGGIQPFLACSDPRWPRVSVTESFLEPKSSFFDALEEASLSLQTSVPRYQYDAARDHLELWFRDSVGVLIYQQSILKAPGVDFRFSHFNTPATPEFTAAGRNYGEEWKVRYYLDFDHDGGSSSDWLRFLCIFNVPISDQAGDSLSRVDMIWTPTTLVARHFPDGAPPVDTTLPFSSRVLVEIHIYDCEYLQIGGLGFFWRLNHSASVNGVQLYTGAEITARASQSGPCLRGQIELEEGTPAVFNPVDGPSVALEQIQLEMIG